jgi:hypothetical protein
MMAGRAHLRWKARQESSGAYFSCGGVSGRHSMAMGVKPMDTICFNRASANSNVSFG